MTSLQADSLLERLWGLRSLTWSLAWCPSSARALSALQELRLGCKTELNHQLAGLLAPVFGRLTLLHFRSTAGPEEVRPHLCH